MTASLFETRRMLRMLDQMLVPKTFLLDLFFSSVETSNEENIDIDIIKGKRRLAPFVSPQLEGKPVERIGFTTRTYKPPYVKPKMVFDTSHLPDRMPGSTIYDAAGSPASRAAAQLAKDFAEMMDMIVRREEWMAAQALNNGVITVTGEGVSDSIDFGMPATHKITLTSTDKWTDAASNPIADLMAWRRRVAQSSGLVPNAAVVGANVVDAFLANEEAGKQLDTRRADIGAIRVQELPSGATYLGSLFSGGLDLYTYDEWYIDDAGNEQPMVPVNKVFLGSTRARTARHYGMIRDIEAGDASVRWFPKSWVQPDPSARWTMLQSAPLVVPHQIDAFLTAQPID